MTTLHSNGKRPDDVIAGPETRENARTGEQLSSATAAHQSNIMLRELFEAHPFKSDTGLFKHAASSSAALPLSGVDETIAVSIKAFEGFGRHRCRVTVAPPASVAIVLAVRWSTPGLAVSGLAIV